MENFIYFSRYIQIVKEKMIFYFTVFTRAVRILFTHRRSIRLIHLDFAHNYQFTNSYLIIRYKFRNALWFHFKGMKKTIDYEKVILNLKNIPEFPIELVVHGLFQKKIFILKVTPENTLINTTFKTTITRIREINANRKQLELQTTTPFLVDKKPSLLNRKTKLTFRTIKKEYPSFNQTDYL